MKIAAAFISALLLFQQPESPKEANRAIQGTVVNLSTGTPLASVTVMLISRDGGNLTTTTGRDGKFQFTGVAQLRGSILVTAPGFNYPASSVAASDSRTFSFESGQPSELRIGLVPAFAVSGRVLDENNLPVPRIPIRLAHKGYLADGSPALTGAAGFAVSDERGEFRVPNVIPGEYAVWADRDSVTTYYPGVRFPDQAVPLSVADRDVAGINFSLLSGQRYSLGFRLSGIAPIPKEIEVQLQDRSSAGRIPTFRTLPTTDAGVYTIDGILPGSYRLMTHWYEEQPPGAPVNPLARTMRTIPIEMVDRDLDLGVLEVERRASIDGRITFKGMNAFRPTVILEPYADEALKPQASSRWNDENSMFSIADIPEGRYTIRALGLPEQSYLATATFNGSDVLGRSLTIDGVRDGTLDVVFDAPAGGITGVVRDAKGDPSEIATVVLLPPADRREGLPLSWVAQTDKDGKFSFGSVAPGEYSLFAWEAVPPNAYRNADWLREFEILATRVAVPKGTVRDINLRSIPKKR